MTAGVLYRDAAGRVLLSDPVYRDAWDLPSGTVAADESPHAACRRGVVAALRLDRPLGRLLAIDWVPSRPAHRDGVTVIYDGGVLGADEVDAITYACGDAVTIAFVEPSEVPGLVTPPLARRIAACSDAVAAGTVASLENGRPAGEDFPAEPKPR